MRHWARTEFAVMLHCARIAFAALLLASTGLAPAAGAPPSDPVQAEIDSLRAGTDSLDALWSRWTPQEWTASTDSLPWIPSVQDVDATRARAKSLRIAPGPVLGFNKVNGASAGIRLGIDFGSARQIKIHGTASRAFSRGIYEGSAGLRLRWGGGDFSPASPMARTRITGGGKESWGLASSFGFGTPSASGSSGLAFRGTWSRGAVPFGSTRPRLAAAQSLLLGLDAQSYLDREECTAGFELALGTGRHAEIVWVEQRDRPLHTALDPLFHTDPRSWKNSVSERVHTEGVLLGAAFGVSPRWYAEPTGVWTRFGTFETRGERYYTAGAEARVGWVVPGAEMLDLELWGAAIDDGEAGLSMRNFQEGADLFVSAGAVAGSGAGADVGAGADAGADDTSPVPSTVPLQAYPDLGGPSSLRGFASRAFVGNRIFLVRADYIAARSWLGGSRVPLLHRLQLQPVLFADAGAVWVDDVSRTGSSRSTTAEKWLFDYGFGLQRNISYPGVLSRLRVDFAVRTDRDHDRWRASLQLIR